VPEWGAWDEDGGQGVACRKQSQCRSCIWIGQCRLVMPAAYVVHTAIHVATVLPATVTGMCACYSVLPTVYPAL
jgi:hypothetical protein